MIRSDNLSSEKQTSVAHALAGDYGVNSIGQPEMAQGLL